MASLMLNRIKAVFTESIQTQISAAEMLPEALERAAQLLTDSVLNGQRIFTCGEQQAANTARQFGQLMLNGQHFERPPFPVITMQLTAGDQATSYSQQISALGGAGDLLLVFSHGTHAPSLTRAIEAALARGMLIVAVTSTSDADIEGLLGPDDVELRVPAQQPQRVLEVQLLLAHVLCELIENQVFPQEVHDET